MHKGVLPESMSMQQKCVIPMTTKRQCQTSWSWNYRHEPSFGSWEIKLDPWEGKPLPKTTRPSLHCLKLQFYEKKIKNWQRALTNKYD